MRSAGAKTGGPQGPGIGFAAQKFPTPDQMPMQKMSQKAASEKRQRPVFIWCALGVKTTGGFCPRDLSKMRVLSLFVKFGGFPCVLSHFLGPAQTNTSFSKNPHSNLGFCSPFLRHPDHRA